MLDMEMYISLFYYLTIFAKRAIKLGHSLSPGELLAFDIYDVNPSSI